MSKTLSDNIDNEFTELGNKVKINKTELSDKLKLNN